MCEEKERWKQKKEEKDREKVNKLIKNNFTLLLFDSFIRFSDCSGWRKQSNRNQIRHTHRLHICPLPQVTFERSVISNCYSRRFYFTLLVKAVLVFFLVLVCIIC